MAFFLVHRPARANRPCSTVKELILPAVQTLTPTITSSGLREYMFATLPSASISRLTSQRKKTTITKNQAVRQAEILPFLLSIKMFLLQCSQEQAAEFAPICSALRRTWHQKSRSLARLCNRRSKPECAKRDMLNATQGKAAEELPTSPPSFPHHRASLGSEGTKGQALTSRHVGLNKQH